MFFLLSAQNTFRWRRLEVQIWLQWYDDATNAASTAAATAAATATDDDHEHNHVDNSSGDYNFNEIEKLRTLEKKIHIQISADPTSVQTNTLDLSF